MIKLFVVDDEQDTREGLRYYVNWDRFGISVIGEADDGTTALEPILRNKPDIILTDIRMPGMDGLELALKLRELNSPAKIIFISGYEDVSYMKTALKVDAIDYILKPIDQEELAEVMEKVVGLIHDERSRKKHIMDNDHKLMQSMPTLREKFFMTLVRDGIDGEEKSIQKNIDFLELSLPNDGEYCVIVLSIDDKDEFFTDVSEKDKQLISFSVGNICEELINTAMGGYFFENRRGEYVCILKSESFEDESLYALASDIKESLSKYLHLSITVGIGFNVHGISNISNSYLCAYENTRYKLFLGKNKIITSDSFETEDDFIHKFDIEKIQQLIILLNLADNQKITHGIDEIFEGISRYRYADVKYCLNICLQLVLAASRHLMEQQVNLDETGMQDNSVFEKLFRLETLEDMKAVVTEYYIAASNQIVQRRNKKSGHVIEKIKKIIQGSYEKDVNLNEIAQQVYITTTYMCAVFKQETGITINDYLTKVRIDRAKELLKDPKNKSYDICYEIGYSEPAYFSKIFKKYTGLSPSEYRQSFE